MVLFGLLVEVVEGVMIVWPEVMYDAAEIWRISHGVVWRVLVSYQLQTKATLELKLKSYIQ